MTDTTGDEKLIKVCVTIGKGCNVSLDERVDPYLQSISFCQVADRRTIYQLLTQLTQNSLKVIVVN